MKAWVLNDIGEIKLEEVEKPSPINDEVLVRVKAAGICGSDIPRIYQNGAHKMPLVLGHEFSGELEDGTPVGIFPLIPCKKCKPCMKGKYEMCRKYNYLGSRCHGGFAEFVSVPKWNIIKLPEGVTYEQAAMLEPMAVSVHAIRRINPSKNESVLVYGLGTIGLLITMFLIEMGIKDIYVVGNKEFQKEQALSLGISEDNYCNSIEEKVPEWVMKKTDGYGVDSVFECIGKSDTISEAIDMVSPGGSLCLVGNPFSDVDLNRDIYWKILRHQILVTGTWNSSYTGSDIFTSQTIESSVNETTVEEKSTETIDKTITENSLVEICNFGELNSDTPSPLADDWRYVLDKLSKGLIHPEKLITHTFDMQDLEKGFKIMHEKTENYIKIMMMNCSL